jgi:hypothetical protein
LRNLEEGNVKREKQTKPFRREREGEREREREREA